MAMGRQDGELPRMWVATQTLARSPGHAFYEKLNEVLAHSGLDRFVEDLCSPHYAAQRRPSIPPGVYFRMLFIGYFEGFESQRAIAWRCADSLSLRAFLGIERSCDSGRGTQRLAIRHCFAACGSAHVLVLSVYCPFEGLRPHLQRCRSGALRCFGCDEGAGLSP
jgi:hypothetical protein